MPRSQAHPFGVQSYCFRALQENARVAEQVRALGLDRLELCGVHADFNDPHRFGDVVRTYAAAGVKIVSLGVQTFTGDADRERRWFECARLAGAELITAHFQIDTFSRALPQAAALAEEFNLRIGIHCHGGWSFGGSPDVLAHLLKLGGPRIGLCLDTAWCLQIGPYLGAPARWVRELFPGRIYGVHYKDFIFDRAGQWQDVVIGTGNLNLPEFVQALDETGFDGQAIVEFEGDPANPLPALRDCIHRLRSL